MEITLQSRLAGVTVKVVDERFPDDPPGEIQLRALTAREALYVQSVIDSTAGDEKLAAVNTLSARVGIQGWKGLRRPDGGSLEYRGEAQIILGDKVLLTQESCVLELPGVLLRSLNTYVERLSRLSTDEATALGFISPPAPPASAAG